MNNYIQCAILKTRQISTVTNVRDSRAALRDSQTTIKQGNNIRVLTLITIAYLPIGFVTVGTPSPFLQDLEDELTSYKGLFSNNQNLLPEDAGATLYIVLNVALSIGTYIVALSLGTILSLVQPRWDRLKEKFLLGSPEVLEITENGAARKIFSNSRGHGRSGSQRDPILPLTKEHESSGTNV